MPFHPRRNVLRSLVVLLIVLAWALPVRSAGPKMNSDPMAIISAVNALRATQGLPPYVVDQGLMAYALEHSRYQASLHTATHQHSDGTTVWQHGMDENIAEGMLGYLTPEYAVYTIWSDAIHMKTMIGYATGAVGAGVADDGANEYYTLDVRPGAAAAAKASKGAVDPNATPTKIIPIVPLLTVTPRPDRWIIHTVGYGQSLWAVAIAYGVKMDQIRDWNSMARDSIDIYAGQKLYIIAPTQIWPKATATPAGELTTDLTVTPGWSVTENPQTLLEKAAYQTAAAQTQAPGQGTAEIVGAAENTQAPPGAEDLTAMPEATAPESAASEAVALAGQQATASPVTSQGVAAETGQSEAESGNLPMIAGVMILVGGSLLLVITGFILRRK